MTQRSGIVLMAILSIGILPKLVAEQITCSSDDMHRHYCHLNPDYSGVRMVHQRSGSPCEEGTSWGTDQRGLWVDHGCRADFVVDRGNYGPAPGAYSDVPPNDPNRGTINNPGNGVSGYNQGGEGITCSSDDMHRHYCHLNPDYSGVRMVHQRSDAACVEGSSWGTDQRGLWVDHGCRADFVVDRGNYGPAPGNYSNVPPNDPNRGTINNPGNGVSGYNQEREKVITCSDNSGHGNHCNAITNGGVELVRQRSGSPCRQDYSWGVDNTGIWVDHGCRADFVLHGVAAN